MRIDYNMTGPNAKALVEVSPGTKRPSKTWVPYLHYVGGYNVDRTGAQVRTTRTAATFRIHDFKAAVKI